MQAEIAAHFGHAHSILENQSARPAKPICGARKTDFFTASLAVISRPHDLPCTVPLPHPSPRNKLWLKRNPWFEEELIPVLRERVLAVLQRDG